MSAETQADQLAVAMTEDASDPERLWKLVRLLGVRKGFTFYRISRGLRENPARAFSWAADCERQAEECGDLKESAALLAWAKKLRNLE